MGIKDTLMNSLGFQDQNDEEYTYEDDYGYEEQQAYTEEQPVKQKSFSGRSSHSSNVSSSSSYRTSCDMRVVLLQPSRFEEAQNISSYLLENKVVVFDLQECDVESSINIVNFVSGTIFALNGSIQKINDRSAIFVAVPPSVSMENEMDMGLGVGDYSLNIADWVNRSHTKAEFQD